MDIFKSCITTELNQMSHVRRYAALPVHRLENVAEHSFYCTFYASLIARDLIDNGIEVNLTDVMLKGVHHDLEEGVCSGDLPRSFKHTTPELINALKEASDIHMKKFVNRMGGQAESTYEYWLNSKDDTIEGRIVELADQLALLAYIREELLNGNLHMVPVAKRAQVHIRRAAVGDLDKYYKQVYPNDRWNDVLRDSPADTDFRELLHIHDE